MLSLTLRGIAAHKRRLVGTVLAVLLGVAFMAGSLVFTDTMRATLSGVFADAERGTDALVRGPATIESFNGTAHAPVDDTLVGRVAGLPGVAAVAPRVEGFAQVVDRDGEPVDDVGSGAVPAGAAWTDETSLNPFTLVEGRGPRGDDEVVVDRSLADEVGLAPGDRTSVLTAAGPEPVEVVGVATFGDADNRAGNRTVLFTVGTAQRLLGREGTVDSIAVKAAEGVSQREVAAAVRSELGGEVEALTGAALAEENANRKNEDVDFFGVFMNVFAGIALLVGAFIINNTFAILVAQRSKELALLRAIGASRKQVRRSVALEAATVGVLASALGLLAGVGVAIGIKSLWQSFGITLPDGPLVVSGSSLLLAFAVGVVVTVGSALLPARRAARVAPVAAMRDVAVEATRPSRKRIALGVLLTAGSAAAVVLGITQRHGRAGAAGRAGRVPRCRDAEPGAGPPGAARPRPPAAEGHRRTGRARPRELGAQPQAHRGHGLCPDDRGRPRRGHHRVRRVRQVVDQPLVRPGVPRRPRPRDRRVGLRRRQPRAGGRAGRGRRGGGGGAPSVRPGRGGGRRHGPRGVAGGDRGVGLRPRGVRGVAGVDGRRRPGRERPARRGQGVGPRRPRRHHVRHGRLPRVRRACPVRPPGLGRPGLGRPRGAHRRPARGAGLDGLRHRRGRRGRVRRCAAPWTR